MSKPNSGYFRIGSGGKNIPNNEDTSPDTLDDHRTVYGGYTTKLNEDTQGRHILGHKNYDQNKSPLSVSMKHAQELTDKFGGSGRKIPNQTREVVNFHEVIGTFVDRSTGERLPTRYGTIHYGQKGCHIVPANPNQY